MHGATARLTRTRPAGTVRAMAYQQPLEPHELDQRAHQATEDVAPSGDPLEPESSSPATGSSPWLIVGLVLLGVFAALLVYAVVLPALT